MSDELGQLLKAAREERGLTLNDLQELTKIQKRYIEAIENGKYHLLPGSFYTRAFVRHIADVLHLNSDQLLKQYESTLPTAQVDITETIPRRDSRIVRPSAIGKWVTTVLLVAFVILIFSIVYYFAVQNFPPKKEANDGQKPIVVIENISSDESKGTDTQPPPPPEEPKAPEPPEPQLTFIEKKENTYFYTIADVKQIDLLLKADNGRCWYRLQKGEGKAILKEGTLENGHEQSFDLEGLSNVYLRMGYPEALKIEINGISIDTSTMKSGERIDITLKPLLGD